MKKSLIFISISFCVVFTTFGQSKINQFLKPSDTLNKSRRNALIITQSSLAAVTLIGLDQLWYADFKRSKFRTTNDNSQWLQMDKLGHVYASYQIGRVGAESLSWTGVSRKDQLIYGATLGFTFLTAVEVFDGFSEEWGFSWGDMLANAGGTGLYVGQELLWKEQRIALKYSFSKTDFAPLNPNKLGNGFTEEFLKDYNGQTYWLSFNLNSFLKTDFIPNWLNFAFGYGADGMLTGKDDNLVFPNQDRYRQFYMSFDIDLTRIKTNSNLLKTLFSVFNTVKVPMPTLEFNGKNGVKAHYIYF
ncbi:DUF2279 domain-containing protein [Winogradskyella sp. PC-19]|uniref:DUF2279 domain-containing protein n=1 Tax=unclassified Winogradskyella TaxID=2615021 RepID=UPI000B3CF175|nr:MULTISPECIES: DUF2279 domain-containing protein [unclassified Winogradskyella]ARV08113.1 DUF2279 domain-containing protein [Winogradskyella sp. PC-19]